MIGFIPNHSPIFIWCDPNTAAFAPNLKLRAYVFDFCCCFHYVLRSPLVYPVLFEIVLRPPQCSRPDAGTLEARRSIRVCRPLWVAPLQALRCDRARTGWGRGTSYNER